MIPNCTNTISKHGHWKNLRQGKDLNNWQKLIKAVGIYERNKLLLSKKYLSLKTRGWKKYLIQKVATLKLFSLTNQLTAFVSGVTLSNDNYRRKNFHTIILRSCCQTNLSWGCPDLLQAIASRKMKWVLNAWMTFIYCGTVCKQNHFWRNLSTL